MLDEQSINYVEATQLGLMNIYLLTIFTLHA